MPRANGASKKHNTNASKPASVPQELDCYEGERLAALLKSIQREIELARLSDRTSLPEKIWFKQQFAIGVNEVTRVLERMTPNTQIGSSPQDHHVICGTTREVPSTQLQAILIAADCVPRLLTKHLPVLSSSRKVPLIFVKDKKGGSLRLGELVKLKTAIAIGVKAKGNAINQGIQEILEDEESNLKRVAEISGLWCFCCYYL